MRNDDAGATAAHPLTTMLDRGLGILEYMAAQPGGLPLAHIADAVDIPRSACHRLLAQLKSRGYVRQVRPQGDYVLTTRLVALGLGFLSGSGIVDVAQPLIERLAERSGELVRLSIVDEDRLTWVAKAEGGRKGFRYDPDMGMDARLSCTSSGHAWLLTLSDERAVALVARQGFGPPQQYGPKAPTTVKALLGFLHAARVRGYAMIDEVFAPGMSAVAAPVRRAGAPAIGVISIAGPRRRLTAARIQALAPALLAAAAELALEINASGLFSRTPLGKG
ncbi:IclR family transcriptional regulator [Caenimonas terrae]|uniref:IclR family transcriptional regulator n=1 Tax=Caenimonas terrae TaxID=696074 RepID=A0ABW0NFJ3_9BURK